MKANIYKYCGPLLPALFLFASSLHSFSQGFVIINEVLAANDNKSGDPNEINEFGHTSEWVELYNPSDYAFNLGGCMLIKGVPVSVVLTNNHLNRNDSSPGEPNFLTLPNVVINEVLAHTDPPLQDAVEIFNPSPTETVNLSGYWLSNSKKDAQKYRIPLGTVIPPLSFHVFYEYQFNPDGTGSDRSFTFNAAHGDGFYIFGASNDIAGCLNGYCSGVEFGASENGVSWGRYENSVGEVEMVPMTKLTLGSAIDKTYAPTPANSNAFVGGFGASNSLPKVGPIIISEIRYDFPLGFGLGREYIELYNMITNVVPLWNSNSSASVPTWRARGTAVYDFPPGISLAPGQFLLLVNFDPNSNSYWSRYHLQEFRTDYGLLAFTNFFEPYSTDNLVWSEGYDEDLYFALYNYGGRVELYRPGAPQEYPHPDAGYVPQILVDKLRYTYQRESGALQRLVPESYGNEPTNWCVATPSPGRPENWRLHSITCTNNTVTLNLSNVWAGTGFTVQYCETLSGTNAQLSSWTKLTNVPPRETTGWRTVTDVVPEETKRFYRVVTPMQ